jgi:U6 snRNA-associated Sm-like protein LSm7
MPFNSTKSKGSFKQQQNHKNSSSQKKDSVIDLSRYMNKLVQVKFAGGREVKGLLRGFDPLVNIVLEDTVEMLRDPADLSLITGNTRNLGKVVCRGTSVIFVAPLDGAQTL